MIFPFAGVVGALRGDYGLFLWHFGPVCDQRARLAANERGQLTGSVEAVKQEETAGNHVAFLGRKRVIKSLPFPLFLSSAVKE